MNFMKFAVPAVLALAYAPAQGLATPILGSNLASFAVLGATPSVTSTGITTIGGNLGVSPAASITDGGTIVFTFGSLQPNTALAAAAQIELDTAIGVVNAGAADATIADGNLDTYQTLQGGFIAPGVYDVGAATANLTGTLVLDGGGSDTAVWRFRLSSTLITGTTSNVVVQNVGDGSNVGIYWSVADAATLNGPTFVGNVLANNLISSDGNLTITCGRLLSAEAQVTLIGDNISIGCGAGTVTGTGGEDVATSGGFDQAGSQVTITAPEPATLALLGLGLAGLGVMRRRRAA